MDDSGLCVHSASCHCAQSGWAGDGRGCGVIFLYSGPKGLIYFSPGGGMRLRTVLSATIYSKNGAIVVPLLALTCHQHRTTPQVWVALHLAVEGFPYRAIPDANSTLLGYIRASLMAASLPSFLAPCVM